MSDEKKADQESTPPNLVAYNYCISFLDLLGQRDTVRDQGLLPRFNSEEEKKEFQTVLRNSIGTILRLQEQAETMTEGILEKRPDSPLRTDLSPENQRIWDEMLTAKVNTQRWSDGLVSFVCLGDQDVKCPMNGVFGIFALAGSICLLGLAGRHPVRGSIDVAWGVELRPGELYGPAVARAYELESEVAQYPRIVVGPRAVQFLEAHRTNPEQDFYSQFNRSLAEVCLRMLFKDLDGSLIVHYLGEEFQKSVSQSHHSELYNLANQFVAEQFKQHRESGNSKLAFRYSHLVMYFESHPPPPDPSSGDQTPNTESVNKG